MLRNLLWHLKYVAWSNSKILHFTSKLLYVIYTANLYN